MKFGIVNESVKCHYGINFDNSKICGPKDKELFANDSIALVTGRRDYAAFQVIIKGEEDFTVSVGSRPAFSPRGSLNNIRLNASIVGMPKNNISMNIVGYIDDDNGIEKTDILLNDEVVNAYKGKAQPVWIEVNVPENTAPGVYLGTIDVFKQSMFEDEIKVKTLSFQITVKDVLLSQPRENKFHLDLWQHLSNIARKQEVHLWSDEHFKVIEEYVKTLGDLGQKAITIIASEIPWSGQGCSYVHNYPSDLFEYNMVKINKTRDEKFIYDFSVVERYINLCLKYGIKEEIEIIGLVSIWKLEEYGYGKVAEDYADAVRLRYYDESDECYKYIKRSKEIQEYIIALEQFFISKNWIHLVRIVADEPADEEVYDASLAIIREIAPTFRFKTAINNVEFIDKSKGKIEDFVPDLTVVCNQWEELNNMRSSVKGRLYWYVCCVPQYPNTFIASPLLESRFIGLITSYLNLEGFLRWNYTVWPENPRTRISYKYPFWKAGDMNFVYPANNGVPLLSLRYKNLKRGIQEFELIERLKLKYGADSEIINNIWNILLKVKDITRFYEQGMQPESLYSLNFQEYDEVRNIIFDELGK